MKLLLFAFLATALLAPAQSKMTVTTNDGSTVELFNAYVDVNGSHQSVIVSAPTAKAHSL